MEHFLGTWVLGKSENFDEYLTARGVPWLIRKMMQMASITKIFKDNTDGTYTLINRSPTKTLSWTFKFHETIHDMGFDGKKHDITFECKDNALYETHVRVEEADKTPETYKYVREGDDLLILILQHKDLLAKRFFKKQA